MQLPALVAVAGLESAGAAGAPAMPTLAERRRLMAAAAESRLLGGDAAEAGQQQQQDQQEQLAAAGGEEGAHNEAAGARGAEVVVDLAASSDAEWEWQGTLLAGATDASAPRAASSPQQHEQQQQQQPAGTACPVCGHRWLHGVPSNAELNAHIDECLTRSFLEGG